MAYCGNYSQDPAEACEDCVQVVKTVKNVRIPCTRNTFQQYTVKVPRVVQERVGRTVNFTEMENRTRQVPYTVNRPECRTRMESRSYQVPVQRTNTRMVSVTRKVPKTIYVDVTTKEPRQYTSTVMECRNKQVPVNYTVQVPETKYRTETYQEPVQKTKTVFDNVSKTVFDTEVRTRCVPVTKMVTKEVPVYNLVSRAAAPCPPDVECGQVPLEAATDDNEAVRAPAGRYDNARGSQFGDSKFGGSQFGGSQFGGYAGSVAPEQRPFEALDKTKKSRFHVIDHGSAPIGGQRYNAGAGAAVGVQRFNAGVGAGASGGQGYNAGAVSGGASAVKREARSARKEEE